MRWHLLKTFDKIYVLDLHGNAKKKEVTPDGRPDKNVFDIQQGVAIIIGVKTQPTVQGDKRKKGADIRLATVYHADLWGERKAKYDTLWRTNCAELIADIITPTAPFYFLEPLNKSNLAVYNEGFSVSEFWLVKGLGFQSSRDDLVVDFSEKELTSKIERFCNPNLTDEQARALFFGSRKDGKYLKGDTRQWSLPIARKALMDDPQWRYCISRTLYRPFDERSILYRPDMVDWPRPEVLGQMQKTNLALITNRQTKEEFGALVSDKITERKIAAVYDASTTFPLYLYPAEDELDQTRRVNFDDKLYAKLRKLATHPQRGTPDEVAVFDYIYGVLHSPAYRETYAEFLKIDFPRIPWPASPDAFWEVSDKGGQLRRLHLMEAYAIGDTPFPFMGEGDNTVSKLAFEDGKVWINDAQYFDKPRRSPGSSISAATSPPRNG